MADALHWLSEQPAWEPGSRRRWLVGDRNSLGIVLEIEHQHWYRLTPRTDLPPDTRAALQLQLSERLHTFHGALPYVTGERHWLADIYGALIAGSKSPGSHTAAEKSVPYDQEIRTMDARIISAGIRRTVTGRELVRRWWSWRRQADQFDGQGTVLDASLALADISCLLDPYGSHSLHRIW